MSPRTLDALSAWLSVAGAAVAGWCLFWDSPYAIGGVIAGLVAASLAGGMWLACPWGEHGRR